MKVFPVVLLIAQAVYAANPNILVIYTDDQGYGDLSIQNPQAKFQTPHLDRLAREGIRFTDGHSPDTVCTPSRYGLLTGRYAWRTTLKRGVMGAEGTCLIADGRMTLASLLRANGYATAMVGKWHLGMDFPGTKGQRDWTQPVKDMPLDKGFDYYWGIPASMNYGVLAWFEGRFAKVPPTLFTSKKPSRIAISDYRIMPPYQETPKEAPNPEESGGRKMSLKGKGLEVAADFVDSECLDRFTRQALKWLDGQAEAARKGKPFFLYVPYTSPHKPVIPLPEFRDKGKAGAYGSFMVETDHHVGRILHFLDTAGLAANTLVVFTSDNGPETTWKERIKRYQHDSSGIYKEGKRSIYEGGHRVPFLVRWPAGIQQPGRTCDRPVCQTDLLATFAEMLKVKLPDDAGEDSESFYPSLIDPGATRERVPMIHHGSGGRFAIREGRWKLIMPAKKAKHELYDLVADPGEEHNRVADHPEVARALAKKITAIVANGRSTPGKATGNDTPLWPDVKWRN
ncbi:MAG: arylsulfatase [Verrucomicrobiota bacterium]